MYYEYKINYNIIANYNKMFRCIRKLIEMEISS